MWVFFVFSPIIPLETYVFIISSIYNDFDDYVLLNSTVIMCGCEFYSSSKVLHYVLRRLLTYIIITGLEK